MFAALAALVITGFTFVNYGNQAVVLAADFTSCEAHAWVTDDSHIPLDVVDKICFLPEDDPSGLNAASINPSASYATDSGAYFEAYLQALELTERAVNAAFTAPSVGFENSFVHWKMYLEAFDLADSE